MLLVVRSRMPGLFDKLHKNNLRMSIREIQSKGEAEDFKYSGI